jgi:hypothetical protein
MKILFIIPSNINSATGRYVNLVAKELLEHGFETSIVCSDGSTGRLAGVHYLSFEPQVRVDDPDLLAKICALRPDAVFLAGCRLFTTYLGKFCSQYWGAKIFIQHEDPDAPVFQKRLKHFDTSAFKPWLKDVLSDEKTSGTPSEYIKYSRAALTSRSLNPWFECFSYAYCMFNAAGHFAISPAMSEYLSECYGITSRVLPPVVDVSDSLKLFRFQAPLRKPADRIKIALGGGIYEYDHSFTTFLRAFAALDKQIRGRIDLTVFGRWWRDIEDLIDLKRADLSNIKLFKKPDDFLYDTLIGNADIFAVPSCESNFSRLRFPSRIAKPMLMGKNILVHRSIATKPLVGGANVHTYQGEGIEEVSASLACMFEGFLSGATHDLSNEAREFALSYFDHKPASMLVAQAFWLNSKSSEPVVQPVSIDPQINWIDRWFSENKVDGECISDYGFFYSTEGTLDCAEDFVFGTNKPLFKLDERCILGEFNILYEENDELAGVVCEKKHQVNAVITKVRKVKCDKSEYANEYVIRDDFDLTNIYYLYTLKL